MNRVLRLPRNTAGRDFIAGDIHGCYGLLDRALEVVGFDAQRDRLIVTGDLVDRGPEPMRALDYLARDWFHSVMGNHDFFFAEGLAEAHPAWANHNGGDWYFDIEPEDRRRVHQVYCGHTIMPAGPGRCGNTMFLDTGAFLVHRRGDGALTLLDVPGDTGVAVERHGHVQLDLRAQPNPANVPALEWSPAL